MHPHVASLLILLCLAACAATPATEHAETISGPIVPDEPSIRHHLEKPTVEPLKHQLDRLDQQINSLKDQLQPVEAPTGRAPP